MENITNSLAKIHLGKKSKGSEKYDPSLLVAIPRIENRKQYGFVEEKLPFLGSDVWQAYEFSSMSENNLPISAVLKFKYDAKSEFLIESKSLKLYLNSFNMSNFGKTSDECFKICKKLIQKDLSNVLKTPVEVNFLNEEIKQEKIFNNFKNILNFIDEKKININSFKESPELLEFENSKIKEYFLRFNSLRSNCRVTHQPDFGEVFVYYKSKKHILENSLVKYFCSFRKEYHFHEECCEMIFKRLFDILDENDELFVCCLYTRRGGIDINPVRYSKNCNFKGFMNLLDLKKYARANLRQ